MLGLLVDERPLPVDTDRATYFINAASILVADFAGHPDWIGLDLLGVEVGTVVAAPRRAVMIAEQLAKRAYENPNAIVAEGGIGPIGGDRMVEEYARTLEPTEAEMLWLAEAKRTTGIVGAIGAGLWTLQIEVRPSVAVGDTIWYNDLDPRAAPWPINVVGQSFGASGGLVP